MIVLEFDQIPDFFFIAILDLVSTFLHKVAIDGGDVDAKQAKAKRRWCIQEDKAHNQ